MSWRTQGQYRGLAETDRDWLRRFDRRWDTKAEGRTRHDVYDHLGGEPAPCEVICPRSDSYIPKINEIAAAGGPDPFDLDDASETLELKFTDLADNVVRFTVPRKMHTGWSIHLVLTDGRKHRVRFPDKAAAFQAYAMLTEFCLSVSTT